MAILIIQLLGSSFESCFHLGRSQVFSWQELKKLNILEHTNFLWWGQSDLPAGLTKGNMVIFSGHFSSTDYTTWARESPGPELLHVSWIWNVWKLIYVKYYAAWMSYQDWWFETGEVKLICTQPVSSVLVWVLPLHMVLTSSTEWLLCAVVGQESRREMGSYVRVEGTSNSSGSCLIVWKAIQKTDFAWHCFPADCLIVPKDLQIATIK